MLYVLNDKEFKMSGFAAYYWSIAYFFTICFQLTYGKYLVTEVKMEMWTRVLYNQVSILILYSYCTHHTASCARTSWGEHHVRFVRESREHFRTAGREHFRTAGREHFRAAGVDRVQSSR
jgi:hypothetical protein